MIRWFPRENHEEAQPFSQLLQVPSTESDYVDERAFRVTLISLLRRLLQCNLTESVGEESPADECEISLGKVSDGDFVLF